MKKAKSKKQNIALIMVIYLAGIFMGAIDTGIVTPARTVIQSSLGVDATTGIWMITIYTLAYAASIPIMGKLADTFGRKYVYLFSITLFGTGSLFCGLSESFGGFPLLILARAVQALGGGGILPVATAEFGTSFPPEKRGMALGLVGGVYGIANVFGSSAGSAIMDIFGVNHWSYIFYINVPITAFILLAGFLTLPNNKAEQTAKIDGLGICTLTAMILSLLYGLKNLDFFAFGETIGNTNVYPFLLLFIFLLPVFILIEKKAADPVINLGYFTDRNIVIALIISFVSGFVMMGMIFVPQFSENALKIATGSGGYLVIILGLFAGAGAPVSGKLIDKFGAKVILGFGFLFSVAGSLFLVFITTAYPNLLTVVIGLILIGLGMGFTMGTPLNYIMLANTDERQSNSSLATMSLVRSIGTAIAPAVMIGFIAHAGLAVQDNIMEVLPDQVNMPALAYSQDITDEINRLKADPDMADQFADMDMPDLTEMTSMDIDMAGDSDYEMPEDLLALMQDSDVTTIVANTKTLVTRMFGDMLPEIVTKIDDGVNQGIDGVGQGMLEIKDAVAEMQEGYDGISEGINGMRTAITAQKDAQAQLADAAEMLRGFLGGGFPKDMTLMDFIPEDVQDDIPEQVLEDLAKVTSLAGLQGQIADLDGAMVSMNDARGQLADAEEMLNGFQGGGFPKEMTALDFIPAEVQEEMPEQVTEMLEDVNSISSLKKQIRSLEDAIDSMTTAEEQLADAVEMLNGFRGGNLPQGMTILSFIPQAAQNAMPQQVLSLLQGVDSLDGLNSQIQALNGAISGMQSGLNQLTDLWDLLTEAGISEIPEGQTAADLLPEPVLAQIPPAVLGQLSQITSMGALQGQISGLTSALSVQENALDQFENLAEMLQSLSDGDIPSGMKLTDFIPEEATSAMPEDVLDQLADVRSVGELKAMGKDLRNAVSAQEDALVQMEDMVVMLQQLSQGNIPDDMQLTDFIPEDAKAAMPDEVLEELAKVRQVSELSKLDADLASAIHAQQSAREQLADTETTLQALSQGRIPSSMKFTDFIPEDAKQKMPASVLEDLADISSLTDLENMIKDLHTAQGELKLSIEEALSDRLEMADAMGEMDVAVLDMNVLQTKMVALRDSVPSAFDTAQTNYLQAVEERQSLIERMFQDTLNQGFRNVYLTAAIASVVAILLLLFYSTAKEKATAAKNQQKTE